MACRRVMGAAAALACGGWALAQDISYEKYALGNGMTVILHRDASLPVAGVNIWYRVGAKDEPPGRSGFAHLYEHLMFMGTQRVPGGEFDAIMEAGGGSNNATTSFDRTNYFSSGPGSLLPTLLWLDADRLEDLGRAMTQEKLDLQRDVVRNEIRQNVENRPYGRAEEAVYQLMYPPGHPYHKGVYGTHEDLEAATVANVKDFFATFYVSSNASLVVAGDFEPARVKPMIEKLYGTLAAGAPVEHRAAEAARLERPARATMLDKVQLARIMMVYHSPALFADGDAEMDLVAGLLADGKTSRLYKRLVIDDKTAADVVAYQASAGLGSLFHIEVTAAPGSDLGAVERAVDEEIERLLSAGVEAEELDLKKNTFELSKLQSLQSVQAKADLLNMYEYAFGEPNSFKRDLDRYRNATPAGTVGWARRVLVPERLVIRVLPEQPEREETPRDNPPGALASGEFVPQMPEEIAIGGVPAMLWRRSELPLVSVVVLYTPGEPGSPRWVPQRAGAASLAAEMLGEGTADLSALEFADAMQRLGATFGARAGYESASVSLTVLKRNFAAAAGLMGDAMRTPRMAEEDWARVKRLRLEELRQQDDQPTIVASRVGLRALFGEAHPLGWPLAGTPETVRATGLDEVMGVYGSLFRPEHATVLIAGDVTAEEARRALGPIFESWKPGPAGPLPVAAAGHTANGAGLRMVVVDRPDAVQTVIRFVMPGPAFSDARRNELRVINTILGGSFTSRLNQNLREKHGFTYGAGSRFVMEPSMGYFTAASSVRADVTGPALREFLAELEGLRAGSIGEDEAAKGRQTLRTDIIDTFAGLRGVLGVAAELRQAGLPFGTVAEDLRAVSRAEAGSLNRHAREAVPLERGVLVLVGDKRVIAEQVKGLGLPDPIEVDIRGNEVRAKE